MRAEEREKRGIMRIQFDTRDKKPKVWNILVLSCLTVVAIVLLALFGEGVETDIAIGCISIGYFAIVIGMLLSAWVKQIQYNPYSYNTIYYMGFAFFLLSVLVSSSLMTIDMIRFPEEAEAVTLLPALQRSARTYLLISFPFILVFSIALFVSNVSLIRHEGKRVVNVLGIILSFMLLGGEAVIYFMGRMIEEEHFLTFFTLAVSLMAAVYLYFESMLLGSIIANIVAVRYEPDPDKDYLIILGCGLRKDGTPTPLLKGRIDRALRFRQKQLDETGKDLIFVTSGGKGPDEVISESASMKQYLLKQGIPEDHIIEEDQSTDTHENMRFSKEKILKAGEMGKVAFATTNYHVFRSGLCARRVKMRAVGMGAKTKWYFWPNAAVREFVGLLTEHRLKQGLIFGGLIGIYVILALLSHYM